MKKNKIKWVIIFLCCLALVLFGYRIYQLIKDFYNPAPVERNTVIDDGYLSPSDLENVFDAVEYNNAKG